MESSNKRRHRLWMGWRSMSVFLHLLAVSIYGFSLFWQEVNLKGSNARVLANASEGRRFAGRWKYLTHWNHVLQLLTFSICLLSDIVYFYASSVRRHGNRKTYDVASTSSSSVSSSYRGCAIIYKVRDTLFHSLAFPMGIFVTILFWTLYMINTDLVLPKTGIRAPSWLNHIIHSLVGILVLIEQLLTYHKRPTLRAGAPPLIIFILSYMGLIFYIGLGKNYWVYPILAKLTGLFRAAFVAGCVAFLLLLYLFGGLIDRFFWTNRWKRFYLRGSSKSDPEIGPLKEENAVVKL